MPTTGVHRRRPSQELMLINMVPVSFRRPPPPWQVWMRYRGPFKCMEMLHPFSCDALGLGARAMALDCALGKLPHQERESQLICSMQQVHFGRLLCADSSFTAMDLCLE